MSEFYAEIPEELKNEVVLYDGVLHASVHLQGNSKLIEYFYKLNKRGVAQIKWYSSKEFEKLDFVHSAKSIALGENDIQKYFITLVDEALKRKASDIHIDDYGKYTLIRFRILGNLENYTEIPGEFGRQLISSTYQSFVENGGTSFAEKIRQDGRISNDKLPSGVHSIRVHTEPIQCLGLTGGQSTTMKLRLLYDTTNASGSLFDRLNTLGYNERQISDFIKATNRSGGHFLSGITGAGKSTALKHLIEGAVERYPHKAFMSAEDPIEQFIQGVMQILVYSGSNLSEQEKITAFNEALAGQLRSDPDYIIVGECRDTFSAKSVFNAANGGHIVYTTIHASNAMAIPQRLVFLSNNNSFDNNILNYICDPNILSSLEYQCLIPILCPECKIKFIEAIKLDKYKDLYFFDKTFSMRVQSIVDNISNVYVKGEGCPHCNGKGFVSQKVAAELVLTNQELLKLIARGEQKEAYQYFVQEQKGTTYIRNGITLIEKGEADPFIVEERLGKSLDYFLAMGIDDRANVEAEL